MKKLLMFLVLLFPAWAFGQSSWPPPLILAADPAGSCANGITAYNVIAGTGFFCSGNTWHAMGGTGAGATIQTNGIDNTSQNLLNFINSATDAVGLTLTPSNPSGGQEKFEITGSSYTGNAATATALASITGFSVYGSNVSAGTWITPSANGQCLMSAASNYATTTPSFQTCPSGGVSGLTAGYIPLAGTATTITSDSHMDDGVTTAGVITSTEPVTITGSAKVSGVETTAPSGVAGSDVLYPDSTSHRWKMINNNGTAVAVAGASGALTSGNCVELSGTTGDMVDAGAPCGSGGGTKTFFVPITQCSPDESTTPGNSFWTVTGLTAWNAGHWEFVNTGTNVSGDIWCSVRVPHNIAVTPAAKIQLKWSINATSGNQVLQTCDAKAADGATMNPASLTCDTAQTVTVPATAYLIKTTTFTVQSTVAADDLLIVHVHKDSTSTATSANALLWGVWLEIDETL